MLSSMAFTKFRIRFDRNDALRMTCVNADCANERNGWVVVLDPLEEKHRGAAKFIENDSGRKYVRFLVSEADWQIEHKGKGWGVNLAHLRDVVSRALPHMFVYVFYPHQQCFVPHLDREVVFTRHSPKGGTYLHTRPLDFNEDQNEVADAFRTVKQRG